MFRKLKLPFIILPVSIKAAFFPLQFLKYGEVMDIADIQEIYEPA